jgi:hypothetical protein
MRWKEIATKLDTLVGELSTVLSEPGDNRRRRLRADPEKAADKWVRRYVRSRAVPLPSFEVLQLLLARASYAATFARLAPEQELDVPVRRAVEIVEILMIDLWHGCFKHKWRRADLVEEVAFSA